MILPLKIPFHPGKSQDFITPVVLKDENDVVLVDCGLTGFLPIVESALEAEGINAGEITKIFITHHDHDHMGALAAFKRKYPRIQVLASETEAPYIRGEKKSLRLQQAEDRQDSLPESEKAFGLSFIEMLRTVEPAGVDLCVHDGDSFDWCGGCRVIATPGHTPGHCSLYLEAEKTIITGDAAVSENGKLLFANPQYTLDMPQAEISLQKLKSLPAETYICYHGGVASRQD